MEALMVRAVDRRVGHDGTMPTSFFPNEPWAFAEGTAHSWVIDVSPACFDAATLNDKSSSVASIPEGAIGAVDYRHRRVGHRFHSSARSRIAALVESPRP